MIEPSLTVADVAKLLKINENRVRILARQGAIVGSKIGNLWRFQPADVQRFLDERRVMK